MLIKETPLPGVLLITPQSFGDSRGFFLEMYQRKRYTQAGLTMEFVQDNSSRSQKGTLRGIHFQNPHAQGKLVSVSRGRVFDVAVDLRQNSPTYRQWYGVELDDEKHRQLWLPPGFGHGFYVLSDLADFSYKCTDYYHPESDCGIRWDDPDLGIQWPLAGKPLFSDKDFKLPFLRDIKSEQLFYL